MPVTIQNDALLWTIDDRGRTTQFADRSKNANLVVAGDRPCAAVRVGDEVHPAIRVERSGDVLQLGFEGVEFQARLRIEEYDRYVVLEVTNVRGTADELSLVDVELAPIEGNFGACVLALNLTTNVTDIPGPSSHLRAMSYDKFGHVGARCAIVACPIENMRDVIKQVVRAEDAVPESSVGGAWAFDEPTNRGSYLFNFENLTVDTVDDWIELVKSLGFNQIDFHGGNSFRFGDCLPNPKMYPNGFSDLKAVIDRLHAAGIQAGLHTYAFFIDKACPWVTPVPDSRLAFDAVFTLSEAIDADSSTITVDESTADMSTITGFFERNSVTLRIGEELVTYTGIDKVPPYRFTGCTRGAHGTQKSSHRPGEKAFHLKECFGLFVPDPNTDLLTEVAAHSAEAYNTCGFDMIYLDALDGEDILGGREWGWHYGSRYTWELAQRLDRPALIEMSTFHHHLWHVRARMGAWDHPTRSHKRFIDLHVDSNAVYQSRFLPTNLGWWAVKTWVGQHGEPTFTDDIEYLCAKAAGWNSGLSLMGINPDSFRERPVLRRLAETFRKWETLRRANSLDESVLERLRTPDAEHTMDESNRIRPAHYDKAVLAINGTPATFGVTNPYGSQRARLRIEALPVPARYDDPNGITLAGFDGDGLAVARSADGVSCEFGLAEVTDVPFPKALQFRASNSSASRNGSWCELRRTFDETVSLVGRTGLGLWVHGDGKGEVLNVQFVSPKHISHGIADHYIPIDFVGWRYFMLVEPEGERFAQYVWPYGSPYAIYREYPDTSKISALSVWYNNLPVDEDVECLISPVRALPLQEIPVRNPILSVGGNDVSYDVAIPTGGYIESDGSENAILYGPDGNEIRPVSAVGGPLVIDSGTHDVSVSVESDDASRARVSVGFTGDPIC